MKILELKVPPVIVVMVFSVLLWFLPKGFDFEGLAFKVTSLILFLAGCLIVIMAVLNFRKEKTTVDPTNPEKSEKLVIQGVYRLTRNPMYLGFLLWLIALGLYLGTLAIIVVPLFVVYMNRFQIIPEEKILQEKFGEKYQAYKISVRRWI